MLETATRRNVLKSSTGLLTGSIGTLPGCLAESEESTFREIRIGNANNPDHTLSQIAIRFSEIIEDETDGQLTGRVYAGSLGGEEDLINTGAEGTIDMFGTGITPLTEAYGEEYSFLGAPYIVEDYDHFQALADEYIYGAGGLNENLRDRANLEIVANSYRGLRGTTANKPVRHPRDIQGVQMRLPAFGTWVNIWIEIGAAGVPVTFDELYSSLETGVIDASEGEIQQYEDASLYEVQSHFSETEHLVEVHQWVANTDFLADLSNEERQLIGESMERATEWGSERTIEETSELMEYVESQGAIIIDDVNYESFKEAAFPEITRYFDEVWLDDLDHIRGYI